MTDAAPAAAPAPATEAAPVNLNKVFAGNLNFSATEEDLKKTFGQAGTVTEVQIITRGTRTLGYGFVTYSTPEEAQTAIQTLNDKEIDGRVMSVALAKPQGADAGPKTPKARKPRSAKAPKEANGATEGTTETAKENGTSAPRKRRPRARQPGAAAAATGEGAEEGAEAAPRPARKTKKRSASKPVATKEASKTQLFVGNLPADASEATLREAFAAFKITEAKVSTPRPRTKESSVGGKPYGFVTLESESEQQRALSEVQGKTIGGNELNVKVAVKTTYAKKPTTETTEGAGEAAAAPAATA